MKKWGRTESRFHFFYVKSENSKIGKEMMFLSSYNFHRGGKI